MVDKVFQVLSNLVKKNLVKEAKVPDIKEELKTLQRNAELYDKAGFEALVTDTGHTSLNLHQQVAEKKLALHWREKGYLVITLPDFERHHSRFNLCSTTLGNSLFNSGRNRRVLALIPVSRYKGSVPMTVVETLIAFKNQFKITNDNFEILTVGPLNKIKANVVGMQDPLLLYRLTPENRGGGTFAVVAWWGADIEDIERALGWGRSGYPNLSVFPTQKK